MSFLELDGVESPRDGSELPFPCRLERRAAPPAGAELPPRRSRQWRQLGEKPPCRPRPINGTFAVLGLTLPSRTMGLCQRRGPPRHVEHIPKHWPRLVFLPFGLGQTNPVCQLLLRVLDCACARIQHCKLVSALLGPLFGKRTKCLVLCNCSCSFVGRQRECICYLTHAQMSCLEHIDTRIFHQYRLLAPLKR